MTTLAPETTSTARHTLRVVGKPELDREYDPTNEAEVEATKKAFDSLMSANMLAHTVEAGGGETIRDFKPEAETIVVRQQLVGG